jgi:xylan 1,4-beta-xylosidase
MFGLLGDTRVAVTSSGALANDEIVSAGVRGQPDINAIATRKEHEVQILIWNYHDDDLSSEAAPVDLTITGLPKNATRGLLEQFRIDSSHSNAFAAWKEMGSPQSPSPAQYEQLENAGQLQLLNSPAWTRIEKGSVRLQFALPRQAVSLVRIAW